MGLEQRTIQEAEARAKLEAEAIGERKVKQDLEKRLEEERLEIEEKGKERKAKEVLRALEDRKNALEEEQGRLSRIDRPPSPNPPFVKPFQRGLGEPDVQADVQADGLPLPSGAFGTQPIVFSTTTFGPSPFGIATQEQLTGNEYQGKY